jgi:hypothetical protein
MIVSKLERHVEAIERRFGRLPIIYGYRPWYDALGDALMRSDTIRACDFWVAMYPFVVGRRVTEADRKPQIPAAWKERGARIWQYAGDHSFPDPGIQSARCPTLHKGCVRLDRNVFLGDEYDFARFRGMVPVEPGELVEGSGGPVHGTHVVDATLEARDVG